jgi:DNA-binding IclR family transcriptional regulator
MVAGRETISRVGLSGSDRRIRLRAREAAATLQMGPSGAHRLLTALAEQDVL